MDAPATRTFRIPVFLRGGRRRREADPVNSFKQNLPASGILICNSKLAEASRNPELCPLMERGPDLWPGLVSGYLHLARLPRKLRRQLQRRWKRSLAGLALLLALGQAPALAGG